MQGGTQKITMGRDKRQDKIDAQNAMRNSGAVGGIEGISYLQGTLHAGDLVKAGRDPQRGNVIPYKELPSSIEFGQRDDDYHSLNAAVPNYPGEGRSGALDVGASMTTNPSQDFDQTQMERRLAMFAEKGQGFFGYNDRSRGA